MSTTNSDSKRKYPSWGDFLKSARTEKYRSAREFCSKVEVGISYPQYSRYEAGEQLPNLDQALKLCRLLDIAPLEGILEWCYAQIGDAEAAVQVQNFLYQVRAGDKVPAAGAPVEEEDTTTLLAAPPASRELFARNSELDDVFTFNRTHLALFESDPAYRDIFTFVNSYSPDWITATEIAGHLGVDEAKVDAMLENLSDYGILLLAGGRCRAAKKVFYFPDDEDFFDLRNQNLLYNMQKVMEGVRYDDVKKRQAFRSVVTREMTGEQIEKVIHTVEHLINRVAELPENGRPQRIFSFCVALGERFRSKEASVAVETRPAQPSLQAPAPAAPAPAPAPAL